MPAPKVPFGKKFREEFFKELGADVVPVNHGSYGLTPTPVFEQYISAMKLDFNFPDQFVRLEQIPEYTKALQVMGKFLHCDYHNLAFLDNATSAVNAILRSIPLHPGEKIVMMNTVYGACGNTIKFIEKRYKVKVIVIDLEYPLNNEEIVQQIEAVFKKEGEVKLCLFDTITSMPGVRFPFEDVTKLCAKYNVLSLIDGAHSAGLIPINLAELNPDFYTSNLHKWLYVPRGCAVLYVKKDHHRIVQTFPISHSYVDDDAELPSDKETDLLVNKFAFVGTKNFASISCVERAISFREIECGGEELIWNYCHALTQQAGELITTKKWPGARILNDDADSVTTTMINIEVPLDQIKSLAKEKKSVNTDCFDSTNRELVGEWLEFVTRKMVYEYRTMVPVAIVSGKLYARFSCQVYNSIEDYDYASDALLQSFVEYFHSDVYAKYTA